MARLNLIIKIIIIIFLVIVTGFNFLNIISLELFTNRYERSTTNDHIKVNRKEMEQRLQPQPNNQFDTADKRKILTSTLKRESLGFGGTTTKGTVATVPNNNDHHRVHKTNSPTPPPPDPYHHIIAELSAEIEKINNDQIIYNLEEFGPVNPQTSVFLIQVHSRLQYLTVLLESLSKMRNVNNSLIIFSHDLYLPEMNEAIRNLKFARIMQIFYPYPIQLNPNRFPGPSPVWCPREMNGNVTGGIELLEVEDFACIRDSKSRKASITQIKHHWWWKANFLFGMVNVLRNHTGVVTFLEEDQYLSPDSLWMLRLMESSMVENNCNGCNILSLGGHLNYLELLSLSNLKLSVAMSKDWTCMYTMGLSFNRTLWRKLQRCAPEFCKYNDYNWDWTLFHLSNQCMKENKLKVGFPMVPRSFHIGACGTHYKKANCDPSVVVKSIRNGIERHEALMYPSKLHNMEFDRTKAK